MPGGTARPDLHLTVTLGGDPFVAQQGPGCPTAQRHPGFGRRLTSLESHRVPTELCPLRRWQKWWDPQQEAREWEWHRVMETGVGIVQKGPAVFLPL